MERRGGAIAFERRLQNRKPEPVIGAPIPYHPAGDPFAAEVAADLAGEQRAAGTEHELRRAAIGETQYLGDVDVMFEEFDGYGVRVRLRAMIHRPAARYGWLGESEEPGA